MGARSVFIMGNPLWPQQRLGGVALWSHSSAKVSWHPLHTMHCAGRWAAPGPDIVLKLVGRRTQRPGLGSDEAVGLRAEGQQQGGLPGSMTLRQGSQKALLLPS